MGTLIDETFQNFAEEDCRIVLDKAGYTSGSITAHPKTPRAWTIRRGAKGGRFSIVRQNNNASVHLRVDDATLFQELRAAPTSNRDFELTLTRGGTVRFHGWLIGKFISTPKIDGETREVRLSAKAQAQAPDQADFTALNSDWVASDGTRFEGTKTFSTAIANILQRTGFSWPIEAVIHWRPNTMSSSDDPLSVQFDTGAFYRTGNDDKLRVMSAGEVLDDLLGTFNAQLVLADSEVWRIQQPEAFASGSNVDVWNYDKDGNLNTGQPVSTSATVDLTSEKWDKSDDEVNGLSAIVDSRVIHEYGPQVGPIDFQGDMEEVDTSTDKWDYYDNGSKTTLANAAEIDVQTNATYVRNGSQALEIEGQEVSAGTNVDEFNTAVVGDYAEHRIDGIDKDIGGMKVILRAMPRTTDDDSDPATVPDESRAFWALRLDVSGSGEPADNYFYVTKPRDLFGGWTHEDDLASDVEFNYFSDSDFTDGAQYTESQFSISQVPEEGVLYLRLYHPVSRPLEGNDGSGFTVYCNWDDARFERDTQTEPKSIFRARNDSIENGLIVDRTHRLGTGPFPNATGTVLDDSGNEPDDWSVVGESQQRLLQGLAAVRLLRLQEAPREKFSARFNQPSTEPRIDRAVVFDSDRFWPIQVKEIQPKDKYETTLAELEIGSSTLSDENLKGEEVDSAPSQRVVTTLQDLDDTEFGELEDGGAVTYNADIGAFELASSSAGASLVTIDASGGDTTEQLPPPSSANEALAVRTDTSANTATIKDPNGNVIEWSDHEDSSSIDLGHEEAFYFVSDGSTWYVVENQNLTVSAEAVTSVGGTKNSPPVTLVGTYDSDGTPTSSTRALDIRHAITGTGPTSELQIDIGGSRWLTLDDPSVQSDGDVLVSDGSKYVGEAITTVLTDHADASDLNDVSYAGASSIDDGEILIGNATESAYQQSRLSSEDNITITNNPGGVVIGTDGTTAAHDLSQHENSSINGDPSGVIGSEGGLIWAGTDAYQTDLAVTPSDNEIPVWDATDVRYEFVGAGSGINLDADTSITLDESVLKDGGTKELDVADLAGGLGTSGQVVTTDGAAVSWGEVGSAGIAAGAVNSAEIAAGAVNSSEIGSVSVADLSDAALPNATTAGQVLIWNGTNGEFENATLTPQDNIDITNADGGITIGTTGVASHDLSEHTNSLINGDPSGVAGSEGGLIWAGTDAYQTVLTVTPSDNEVPVWDATDVRYEFVGGGDGIDLDADTSISVDSTVARTNADEEFTAHVGISVQGAFSNTLGSATGEAMRWGSENADFLLSLQEGIGRQVFSWNAYFDGTDWRLMEGSEDAVIYGVNINEIGATSAGEAFDIGVFAESAETADSIITNSWDQEYTFDATGLAIGKTSASYDLHTAGDVAADGTVRDLSDARVKTDLEALENPLERIKNVLGYTYERTDKDGPRTAGVVAQDVEDVLPEAVAEDRDGLKSLDHGGLFALLFSAVNELQERI